MRRLAAALALLLVVAVGAGFRSQADDGSVGGVAVGGNPVQLAIGLDGQVAPTGHHFPGASLESIVVSPDGHWRAVLEWPNMAGNTGVVRIGRNAPGAPLEIVERHLYVGSGSVTWSPDSRWIALSRWVPHLLSAVAIGTDGRRRVLAAPFCGDFTSGLEWEPGGDRIALGVPAPRASCKPRIDLRVRTVGARGQVIARAISGVPEWSPDGRWIAVSNGKAEVMRADGSQRRRLRGSFVSWAPQGDVLAVTNQNGQTLSIGPAAGTDTTWDDNVQVSTHPAFSPDGTLVAYARWDRIVVRRVADRRVVAKVPVADVSIGDFAWRADGRSLTVTAIQLPKSD